MSRKTSSSNKLDSLLETLTRPEVDEAEEAWKLFLTKAPVTEAETIRPAIGETILLSDPDTVWLILAGTVDLFAAPLANGEVAGLRRHIGSFDTRNALFGLGVDEAFNLFANPSDGAELGRISLTRFQALAADLKCRRLVLGLVETWLKVLSTGLAQLIAPKNAKAFKTGQTVKLETGDVVYAVEQVAWVRPLAGSLAFTGRTDLPSIADPNTSFPLAGMAWVSVGISSELAIADTLNQWADGALWPSLVHFHTFGLACIKADGAQQTKLDRARLDARIQINTTSLQTAIAQLGSMLDVATTEPLGVASNDPLVAAIRHIARTLGSPLPALPHVRPGLDQFQVLKTLARAAHLQTRRVALRERWWQFDNGPLLGFIESNNQPVALLSRGNGYDLLALGQDPQPITAATANQLAPFAHSFYRTFPDHALNLWDLIKFSAHDLRREIGWAWGLGIAGGLLAILPPLFTGIIFDRVIPAGEVDQLQVIGLALIASAFAGAASTVLRNLFVLRMQTKLEVSLQAALWDRLLNLPLTFFKQFSSGDLTTRALGLEEIRRVLSGTLLSTFLTGLFSLFSLALLFFYDVPLALVSLGLVSLAVVITLLLSARQLPLQRALSNLQGRLSGMVLQLVNGVSKLRVADAESRAFADWAQQFATQQQLNLATQRTANTLATFNAIYPLVGLMTIFGMIGLARQSAFTAGTFLAFNVAFAQFLGAALQMSLAFITALTVKPLYERAQPILQARPELDELKTDPGELRGEIEVRHVSFRYTADGPLVLDDITLQVQPGEFVALVGPSGCGKSTLLRLLLGFEHTEMGGIFYDGHKLDGLDPNALRRQLGVVLQTGRISQDDIFRNIVGASDLPIEAAWEAARIAGLDKDIEQMPMGMLTVLPHGGTTLSGGQRQRLLIARAIIQKPRILFFDEATSALDNRTQLAVTERLSQLKATRIFIAHRLSTIVDADRIVVFDRGRVVQMGTYRQLVRQFGLFADLVKRQVA